MEKKERIYGQDIEEQALAQFRAAMAQPTTVQGALMADAHVGYTLPIGAVIASRGHIYPSYVGYDIGCGVCALPTSYVKAEVKCYSHAIMEQIYTLLPVGFACHKKKRTCSLKVTELSPTAQKIFEKKDGLKQLGSLGGGNHFVEIGYDEDDCIWILVHSGSRGFGHDLAEYYMALAAGSSKAREGHFSFAEESDDGQNYIADSAWALSYALENRKQIVEIVLSALKKSVAGEGLWDGFINRNHNHAEKRDGLWIHRKGATHAEAGMKGVIPGNMRDGSFIVEGLGNPDSLYSSSHGAGRVMGRFQAKKRLSYGDFVDDMAGITARTGKGFLDESPRAYKDIFRVMALQKDLVKVVHHVRPIINIKG